MHSSILRALSALGLSGVVVFQVASALAYEQPTYRGDDPGGCRIDFSKQFVREESGELSAAGYDVTAEVYIGPGERPKQLRQLGQTNQPPVNSMPGWYDPMAAQIISYRLTLSLTRGFSIELRPGIAKSKLTNFSVSGADVRATGQTELDFFRIVDRWTKNDMEYYWNFGAKDCVLWAAVLTNAVNQWAYSRRGGNTPSDAQDAYVYSRVTTASQLTSTVPLTDPPRQTDILNRFYERILSDIRGRHSSDWIHALSGAGSPAISVVDLFHTDLDNMPNLATDKLKAFTPCVKEPGCMERTRSAFEAKTKAADEAIKAYYDQTFPWPITVKAGPTSGSVNGGRTFQYPNGTCHVDHKIVVRSANPNVGTSSSPGSVVSKIKATSRKTEIQIDWDLPFAGANFAGYALDGTRVWIDATVEVTLGVAGGPKCRNPYQTVTTGDAPPFKNSPQTGSPTQPKQPTGSSQAVSWIRVLVENDDPFANTVSIIDRVAGGVAFEGYIDAHQTVSFPIGANDAGYGSVKVQPVGSTAKGYQYLHEGDIVKGW